MNLKERTEYYYTSGYNCSETLLNAANDVYDLRITKEDTRMMAGFGAGMYDGHVCGACIGSVAAISKKIIETKAHDQLETLRPVIQEYLEEFQKTLGALDVMMSNRCTIHRKINVYQPACWQLRYWKK